MYLWTSTTSKKSSNNEIQVIRLRAFLMWGLSLGVEMSVPIVKVTTTGNNLWRESLEPFGAKMPKNNKGRTSNTSLIDIKRDFQILPCCDVPGFHVIQHPICTIWYHFTNINIKKILNLIKFQLWKNIKLKILQYQLLKYVFPWNIYLSMLYMSYIMPLTSITLHQKLIFRSQPTTTTANHNKKLNN